MIGSLKPYSAPCLTRLTVGDARVWSVLDDLLRVDARPPQSATPQVDKQKPGGTR